MRLGFIETSVFPSLRGQVSIYMIYESSKGVYNVQKVAILKAVATYSLGITLQA